MGESAETSAAVLRLRLRARSRTRRPPAQNSATSPVPGTPIPHRDLGVDATRTIGAGHGQGDHLAPRGSPNLDTSARGAVLHRPAGAHYHGGFLRRPLASDKT
jgi:hypothetical protein